MGVGIGTGEDAAGDLIELTDSLELGGSGRGSGSAREYQNGNDFGDRSGNAGNTAKIGADSGLVADGGLRGRTAGSQLARGFSPAAGAKGGKGD